MKKIISLTLVTLVIIACGAGDKQARLKELEKKRDNLNSEIETLRSELAVERIDNEEIKKVVQLELITPSIFNHFIKIQGTIESDNNILIPAQSSGVIKRIYVSEGAHVKKGQLLAELDGAIYERSIDELKTNLELATTMFERQDRLWNKKIGSEIQYLQAKTGKESLQQRLATVEEQYRLTKIISPIEGSVDQILIRENEATAAGFGTIRVVKLSELKITAKLSEVYLGSIKMGDSVKVEIPLLSRSFTSTVTSVAQVIDSKNRTFGIEIEVPKTEKNIKPNMLVKLDINDYSNEQSLTVPLRSIQKTADNTFLFIAKKPDDNKSDIWTVEKRIVEVGKFNNNMLEIVKGLHSGDYIVIAGHQDLADKQKVRLAISEPSDLNI